MIGVEFDTLIGKKKLKKVFNRYTTYINKYNIQLLNCLADHEHARLRSHFLPMDQEWDYENLCPYCGCLWLKSNKHRKLCCNNGAFVDVFSGFPALNPLPPDLRRVACERINHFSSKSAIYNNLFSIAVTSVDNGREGVGFETFNMPASVKVNGRPYQRCVHNHFIFCYYVLLLIHHVDFQLQI